MTRRQAAEPPSRRVIIALDGPSASGKSSTAQAVADVLGFVHLDSGSLYRGVTLVALRYEGTAPGKPLDAKSILRTAERQGLELRETGNGYEVYLDGKPAESAIRTPEVTGMVSAVSALPEVRDWVNEHLRRIVRAGRSVVVDGRDIGTIVFPDADLKIFLTASARTRARRRLLQRGEPLDPASLERETAMLATRDQADSERPVAPLSMAPDAIALDSTALSFEEQVGRIVDLARR
jgi:cytidylate kinase